MTDRQLMSMAKEASMNAYTPYSRFSVGAALECDDGTVYTGCNVENAALGSTICAERTACVKAVSEGRRSFRRLAIYADSENWCTPCGACRQFLAEFAPELEILCAKAGGRYVSYKLSELLPHTFNFWEMELEQLRIFAALCEEGGFSAAARKLYKSHSSVSRAVSALERELGVTLCVRDSRSFALTEAGERLYTGAKALLKEADELAESMKE